MPAKNRTYDFSGLDADIANFLTTGALASRTVKTYKQQVGVWKALCERHGLPPVGTPYIGVEYLFAEAKSGQLRRNPKRLGEPFTLSEVETILAAARWLHRQERLTPSWALPEHREDCRELRRGYARWLANRERGGVKSAKPLRPPDIQALNAVEAQVKGSRAARLLTALDTGWPLDVIDRIHQDAITITKTGVSVPCPDTGKRQTLAHQCRPAGVPVAQSWCDSLPPVCTACLLAHSAGTGSGRGHILQPKGQWARSRALSPLDGLTHLAYSPDERILRYRDGLTDWQRLGTRLALFHRAARSIPIRRTQARISLAWMLGLRGADEPSRLLRQHLHLTDSTLTVTLPSAKGDQEALGWTFTVRGIGLPATPRGRIVEWLAIADAHSLPENRPFLRVARSVEGDASRKADVYNFARLQTFAGLSGFTLHSTRSGFAVTARELGHSEAEIKHALRLDQTRHLVRYIQDARPSGNDAITTITAHLAAAADIGSVA